MSGSRHSNIEVAVATVDRPEALTRCLDAVASGELLPARVIVVDQGRLPSTQSAVEAFTDEPLRALHLIQEPHGLAASRNFAVAHATQPAVAFTDDDCVPSPGWLAAVERVFVSDPGLAAVCGPMLPLEPEGERRAAVSSRTSMQPREFTRIVPPWSVGTGGNMVIARNWLTRVGGYDERLGAGTKAGAGEDLDLIDRLLRAGGRIRYEPAALVWHERQTHARRLLTRSGYGRGVGAYCGLRLAGGDPHGLVLLLQWLWLRARLLLGGLAARRMETLREEALVVAGTAAGIIYGLRVSRRP